MSIYSRYDSKFLPGIQERIFFIRQRQFPPEIVDIHLLIIIFIFLWTLLDSLWFYKKCWDRFRIVLEYSLCSAWHMSNTVTICHNLSHTESHFWRSGGSEEQQILSGDSSDGSPWSLVWPTLCRSLPRPCIQLCTVLCNAQYTVQLRRAHSAPRRMSPSLCLSPGLSPLSTHNLHTGHTITVQCTLSW